MICIQEINCKNNSIDKIKRYQCFAKNRNSTNHASEGVAIYLRNYMTATKIQLQTNIEAVATFLSPIKLCRVRKITCGQSCVRKIAYAQ